VNVVRSPKENEMRTLLVAVAAVALVAGSASMVVAQREPLFGPMTPGRVSGELTRTGGDYEGTVQELGELMYRVEGVTGNYEVSSDDARLGGVARTTTDWIGHYPPALVAVGDTAWLIEDDRGAWSGSTHTIASIADEDPINTSEQVHLDGSGAYEGLTAYLVVDWAEESFVGALIPDQMPELPDDWLEQYQAAAVDADGE
jgi:hypothetical protein